MILSKKKQKFLSISILFLFIFTFTFAYAEKVSATGNVSSGGGEDCDPAYACNGLCEPPENDCSGDDGGDDGDDGGDDEEEEPEEPEEPQSCTVNYDSYGSRPSDSPDLSDYTSKISPEEPNYDYNEIQNYTGSEPPTLMGGVELELDKKLVESEEEKEFNIKPSEEIKNYEKNKEEYEEKMKELEEKAEKADEEMEQITKPGGKRDQCKSDVEDYNNGLEDAYKAYSNDYDTWKSRVESYNNDISSTYRHNRDEYRDCKDEKDDGKCKGSCSEPPDKPSKVSIGSKTPKSAISDMELDKEEYCKVNNPPEILGFNIEMTQSSKEVRVGENIIINATVNDKDGDKLEYRWEVTSGRNMGLIKPEENKYSDGPALKYQIPDTQANMLTDHIVLTVRENIDDPDIHEFKVVDSVPLKLEATDDGYYIPTLEEFIED